MAPSARARLAWVEDRGRERLWPLGPTELPRGQNSRENKSRLGAPRISESFAAYTTR
jgi:hypothetical protein